MVLMRCPLNFFLKRPVLSLECSTILHFSQVCHVTTEPGSRRHGGIIYWHDQQGGTGRRQIERQHHAEVKGCHRGRG